MPVQEQVVVLFAGTRGHLDDVAVNHVRQYETELLDFMRSRHGALLNDIVATGKVDEDSLSRAISDFASTFDPGIGSGAEPAVEAQADADVQTVNAANHLPEEDVARPEGE